MMTKTVFLLWLVLIFKKTFANNETAINTTQLLDATAAQPSTSVQTSAGFTMSINTNAGSSGVDFTTNSSFRPFKFTRRPPTTEVKKINKIANIRNGTVLNTKESFDPATAKISTTSENYEEFLRNSDVFLDTSLLIKFVLTIERSDVIMFSFPHRWGKTINLQMIKYFLEIHVDKIGAPIDFKLTPNFRLFAQGEVGTGKQMIKLQSPFLISNEKELMYINIARWPVIYLNFTRVIGNNYIDYERNLEAVLRDAYKEHQYVRLSLYKEINSKKEDPKGKEKARDFLERYNMFLDGKAPDDDKFFCLDFLCEVLHHHFRKNVYILIDNIDYGLNYMRFSKVTFTGADKYKYLDLLRTVLIHTHMSNFFLEKWILTSSVNYGKHSVFPPLDIVLTFDFLNDEVSSYFGFNQTEANALFDLMQFPQQLRDDAHDRYWGYNTGKLGTKNKYCTWSIVNMVNNKQVQDYWIEASYKEDYLQTYLKIPKVRQIFGNVLNTTRQKIRIKDRNITLNDYRYILLASNHTYRHANSNVLDVVINVNPHLDVFKNDTDFKELFDWSRVEEEWVTEAFTKIALYKLLYMSGYLTLEKIVFAKKTEVFWATFPNKEVHLGIRRYLEQELNKPKSEEFY